MNKRPNVLILMSDEQRSDVLGFTGNKIIKTPVLDKLAHDGVIFEKAYTASPICVPGRQCFMSGQLPKTCGCEGWKDLEPGYLTFSRLFSRYAYRTVACGKLHQRGNGDVMQGWIHRIGYEIMQDEEAIEDRIEEEFKKYRRKNLGWSETKEVQRAGVGRSPWIVEDQYTIQGAVNFLEEHFINAFYDKENPEQPVMLKVSLNQPHYPFITISEEKFAYYLNRVKPFVGEELFDIEYMQQRKVIENKDASYREIQRATAAYYAMVETTDEYFGQIIKTLEHVGQNIDDWIVVYLSDHGEQLGQHSIWEKKQFFEGSVNVPLVIRYPKKFGHKRVDKNVNLCDVYATLCELCGIEVPKGLDSRSLIDLMNGQEEDWNNESVSQYNENNVMIKKEHLKYIYLGDTREEVLFDHDRDPSEKLNVINDNKYTQEIKWFRERCSQLGHGKNPVHSYLNAGYTNK